MSHHHWHKGVGKNHVDIAKPQNRNDVVYKWVRESLTTQGSSVPPRQMADVVFVAGRPSSPVFWLFNRGPVPAERPKYGFVLYDIDEDDVDQPRKILHIPFKLIEDYILPGHGLGPWRVLDLSDRARGVPRDHRVFGYVSVQCLTCQTIRYYWLYFKNGHSGWLREINEDESGSVNRTLASIIYARDEAAAMVDEVVPRAGRTPLE